MWLPVMDSHNDAMLSQPYEVKTKFGSYTVAKCTMFDVNKTIMRCLTKNLAMFGLGLYIYAGEDLPVTEEQEIKKPEEKKFPETPEAKQLKLKIVDLIAENKLSGKALERANALMSNNDVDGMKKCIEYATAQKSA